jgi:hypothetical protein
MGRRTRGVGVGLALGLLLAACADKQESSCDCVSAEFIATATAGASFAVAGDGCAGTCRREGAGGCLVFVLTAQATTTCTLSATPAVVGATEAEQKVSFTAIDCCGTAVPSTSSWQVP